MRLPVTAPLVTVTTAHRTSLTAPVGSFGSVYEKPYPATGVFGEKSMTGELLKSATGHPTTPCWLGSPTLHVVANGQVRPSGSIKVVADSGTARKASICRWAITSAAPSLRLLAFSSI